MLVCPFACLEYIEEKPTLVKERKVCSICAQACQQYEFLPSKVEAFVFGIERKPDEAFGVYRRLVLARVVNSQILEVCQDGGEVTSLMLFALKEGIIDGAIVAKSEVEKSMLQH